MTKQEKQRLIKALEGGKMRKPATSDPKDTLSLQILAFNAGMSKAIEIIKEFEE